MTFRRVILPLALPALVAGSIFTFSLTLGDYITPTLVSSTQFIGNVVYANVGIANNLPLAAAFATVPVAIMIVYLLIARRLGAFESRSDAAPLERHPLGPADRHRDHADVHLRAAGRDRDLRVQLVALAVVADRRGSRSSWFDKAFHNPGVRDALWTSLKAGLGATAIALVLGTLAAMAVARHRFFGRDVISFLVLLPLALPGIVTGMALNATFTQVLNVDLTLFTVIVGHATFCIVRRLQQRGRAAAPDGHVARGGGQRSGRRARGARSGT